MPKLPEKLVKLLDEINITQHKAVWDCHGTPVMLHKALEKIAAHKNIMFDAPQVISCDVASKEAVICVTGHMENATEWSIGEAAPYNNKNSYPFAMAEKRAKDRVILKLVGLHGDVYSEEEADDFKEAKPQNPDVSVGDTEQRVEAALEFYKNCNAARFEANEKRYSNLIKSVGITEDQYDAVMDAHHKRKKELGL